MTKVRLASIYHNTGSAQTMGDALRVVVFVRLHEA